MITTPPTSNKPFRRAVHIGLPGASVGREPRPSFYLRRGWLLRQVWTDNLFVSAMLSSFKTIFSFRCLSNDHLCLRRWWREQTPEIQGLVKDLVAAERLVFANGTAIV